MEPEPLNERFKTFRHRGRRYPRPEERSGRGRKNHTERHS